MKTLAFRTKSQVILWKHEILGQLSDGHWENFRSNRHEPHYRAWQRDVQVVDRPEGPVGRDFYVDYDGYNLTNADLLDVVGQRMIVLVRLGLTFGEDAVELLEHCFDLDGGWEGLPKYEGQYWDDLRTQINGFLAQLGMTLEDVRRAGVEDGFATEPYDRKRLLADLREMKKIIKTRL